MKIVVFAKGERGERAVDVCRGKGEVALVVAESDGSPNDPALVARVAALRPDLLVLAGYTRIAGRALRETARLGAINLHGGRVPAYRGASVLNWQIIRGEPVVGISVLQVDDGIDTGPVLASAERPTADDESFTEVSAWANVTFPRLLAEVLDGLATGTLEGRPQEGPGTYRAKRYPDDGRIFWRESTGREVRDLVRGLAPPAPGAFTFRAGERIVVRRAALPEIEIAGVPGRVVMRRGDGVLVAAREGGVVLVEVAGPDGVPRTAAEVLRRGDLLE